MLTLRNIAIFCTGTILGAVTLFLYLQQTGQLRLERSPAIAVPRTAEPPRQLRAMPREVEPSPAAQPPASQTMAPLDAITQPVATEIRQLSAEMPQVIMSEETIAIPVAGTTRAQLKDTYTQPRGGSRVHEAIDILAPRGTPVIASVDGFVAKLFNSAQGGITIYQKDRGEEFMYYYAHLDRYIPGLAEKQLIRKGEVIGYVGTSGNAPPGTPHLHFSISKLTAPKEWWKGTAINPYPVLMSKGITYDVGK